MTLHARLLALAVAVAALISVPAAASAAETGRIAGITRDGDQLAVVFQADGLPPDVTVDPASVTVQIAGKDASSQAEPLTTGDSVTRVVVLAIDNSQSMQGEKLDSARAAASTFLARLPEDVQVGLVTFASEARVAIEPTPDHAQIQAAIDAITIDTTVGTALFDGAAKAADLTGQADARAVVPTDGRRGLRQQHEQSAGGHRRREGRGGRGRLHR